MKILTRPFATIAAVILAAASSCETAPEQVESNVLRVTAECAQTKTLLSDGHHTWATGDVLRVLSDDGVTVKSSECNTAESEFDFTISGWPATAEPVYAVYCGQNDVELEPAADGGVITARLDNIQKISHKESFAQTANLSAGLLELKDGNSYGAHLKNVCGLLKFHFSKYDDIKTVTIQDLESGSLAGVVEVGFNDDSEPYVISVKEGESSVTISAAGQTESLGNGEDAELPAGQNYYACVLPGTYRLKITMTRLSGERLVLEAESSLKVDRNVYIDLKDIDVEAKVDLQSGASNENFTEGDVYGEALWKDMLAPECHPRLIFDSDDFSRLKKKVNGTDPLGRLHNCVMTLADQAVSSTERLEFELDASNTRLLAVSREALSRLVSCAYAYRITGEDKYLQKAVQDIQDVCSFDSWNPSHYLDVAEMATAVAIAYDWLYAELSESVKAGAVQALKDYALQTSRKSSYTWWYGRGDNWNQVCNGGLVCAAVATYEHHPELAKTIIDDAISTNTPTVARMYAPDGAYPEGPTYWNYGTLYQVLMLTVFEGVFGTDYGISKAQGFMDTGEFKIFARGTIGMHFNYADNTTSSTSNYPLYYFAYKRNEPSMLYTEMQLLNEAEEYISSEHRGLLVLAIKYAMQMNISNLSAPSKKFYSAQGDVPLMMCRTGWAKKDLYLGIKGGRANYSHGHMDGGTFVFYADAVRWAKDMTRQTYSDVESGIEALGGSRNDMAQNSLRWRLFRLNNRQHNTLTVNDKDHKVSAFVNMVSTENTSTRMGATFDLTPLFDGDLAKAERTAAICNEEYLEVKDVLKAPADRPAHVRWTMVSTATPVIQSDGSGIMLTRNNNSMFLKTTGAQVTYKTWSGNPQDYESPLKHLEKPESNTWICGYEIDIPAGQELILVTTLKKP